MFSNNPLVNSLKGLLEFNRRRIYIDNVFFRIHYVWSVIILSTSAILVTSKLYIGEPIHCMSSQDIKDIVKQYCFIHSTFTRPKLDKKTEWIYQPAKENEISAGVRAGISGEKIISHSYYQWVWCFLTVQAITFYFPHWVWEKWEGGITKMLVGDLNLPMLSDEKKIKQRKKILTYLQRNRGYHLKYTIRYFICEILNLINISSQIYLTDYFLENEFSTLGFKVFNISTEKPYLRDDALARIFPTVTFCRLSIGGVAFGKVNYDILCILSINILNEKIYIFIWFWFLIVLIGTLMGLTYRGLSLFVRVRQYSLRHRLRIQSQRECSDYFCKSNSYGEWFFIYKLCQNMDTITFGDLIQDVDQAFRKWDSEKLSEDEIALTPYTVTRDTSGYGTLDYRNADQIVA